MRPNRLQISVFYKRGDGFYVFAEPAELDGNTTTTVMGADDPYHALVVAAKRDNHKKAQAIKAAAIEEYKQQIGPVWEWAVANGYSSLPPLG
jgi:hypothetical protein